MVLIGAFLTIFLFTYFSVKNEIQKNLQYLPRVYYSDSAFSVDRQDNVNYYWATPMPNYSTSNLHFFVILVDENEDISKNDAAYGNIGVKYQSAVKTALKNNDVNKIISFGSMKLQAYIFPSLLNSTEREIYFLDVTDRQKSLTNLLTAYCWITPLTLIPIFLISLYMAKRATRPVREAWEKQRRFVSDASHELKTPLATISINADALLLNDSGDHKKWVGYIKDEVNSMSTLVNSLLTMAKTDDGIDKSSYERFDLSCCLIDTITVYEAAAYGKGIDVRSDIEKGIFLNSDEISVRRIISALIDNAVKYTNQDGFIAISLRKNKSIELQIENSGAGISQEDIPHIFERFYRADKARENEDGSFGLGLSIVKGLLEQFGGEISVQSIPNQRTVFTVHLK
jgi:signal transduction histidine kinase